MKNSSLQKFERIYKSQKQLFIDNLIGGVAWGIGSVIGATLFVALLGIVISRSNNIPILRDVVGVIIEEIDEGKSLTPLPGTGDQ